MTNEQNVTPTDTEQQEQPKVKFTIPENWITSETRMIQRCDHLQSELVELYRRCMMIVTETELLIEGIQEVSKTTPTYKIEKEKEKEEDETNDRM